MDKAIREYAARVQRSESYSESELPEDNTTAPSSSQGEGFRKMVFDHPMFEGLRIAQAGIQDQQAVLGGNGRNHSPAEIILQFDTLHSIRTIFPPPAVLLAEPVGDLLHLFWRRQRTQQQGKFHLNRGGWLNLNHDAFSSP
jgi:hypothetical protein